MHLLVRASTLGPSWSGSLGCRCQVVVVRPSSSGRRPQAAVVIKSSGLSGSRHYQAVVVRPSSSGRHRQAVVVKLSSSSLSGSRRFQAVAVRLSLSGRHRQAVVVRLVRQSSLSGNFNCISAANKSSGYEIFYKVVCISLPLLHS